jgi:hypothetical protein
LASLLGQKMLVNLPLSGAGNEIRTRDLNLGKVALYQLSYSRKCLNKSTDRICRRKPQIIA